MPYVAMGAAGVLFVGKRAVYKTKWLWRDLVVGVLVCLMIVSNQFLLARVVGNGRSDIEFKYLADWYVANATRREKLVTTMSHVITTFAPDLEDSLIHMKDIDANSPQKFFRDCCDKGVRYVAWDSRVGFDFKGRSYRLWGVGNIAMLARPESTGPYEFIAQIRASERRYINLFRLRCPDKQD